MYAVTTTSSSSLKFSSSDNVDDDERGDKYASACIITFHQAFALGPVCHVMPREEETLQHVLIQLGARLSP
jgi:hypothetical protein